MWAAGAVFGECLLGEPLFSSSSSFNVSVNIKAVDLTEVLDEDAGTSPLSRKQRADVLEFLRQLPLIEHMLGTIPPEVLLHLLAQCMLCCAI